MSIPVKWVREMNGATLIERHADLPGSLIGVCSVGRSCSNQISALQINGRWVVTGERWTLTFPRGLSFAPRPVTSTLDTCSSVCTDIYP